MTDIQQQNNIFFMVDFLTVHKMTKRRPARKATGAFMAVANLHIYHGDAVSQLHIGLLHQTLTPLLDMFFASGQFTTL